MQVVPYLGGGGDGGNISFFVGRSPQICIFWERRAWWRKLLLHEASWLCRVSTHCFWLTGSLTVFCTYEALRNPSIRYILYFHEAYYIHTSPIVRRASVELGCYVYNVVRRYCSGEEIHVTARSRGTHASRPGASSRPAGPRTRRTAVQDASLYQWDAFT